MSTGNQYIAAAYGVALFALLIYVVAIGLRAARAGREAELLGRIAGEDSPPATAGHATPPVGGPTRTPEGP